MITPPRPPKNERKREREAWIKNMIDNVKYISDFGAKFEATFFSFSFANKNTADIFVLIVLRQKWLCLQILARCRRFLKALSIFYTGSYALGVNKQNDGFGLGWLLRENIISIGYWAHKRNVGYSRDIVTQPSAEFERKMIEK